jgi:hypothetical protein
VHVLYLREVLPLQLRQDHRRYPRPLEHAVLPPPCSFDNCETYIPPYCQEHLEKRIADCALKARKYKGLKDEVKASHFTQMAASYAGN